MSTIPASELVAVNPSVLGVGGSSLDVIGLVLTSSTRIPIGAVSSFPDASAVSDYFGPTSDEATIAGIYFQGYSKATKLPEAILFAQYNADDVAAYLRSGDVSALTLAELQALSGSLDIVVDGYDRDATSVSLAAATSFSSAASIIQTALNAAAPSESAITGSISGTTLTVTAKSSGTVAAGQTVHGTGVTAGTIILSQLTGSVGGTGTYRVGTSQTALSAAMTTSATSVTVTYDSVSGAFVVTSGITGDGSTIDGATGTLAASVKMTLATGAVLSQGADAASPAAFMNGVVAVTTDWVTFMTLFDPDDSGNDNKQAFADWKNTQNNRYAYVCWDLDPTPTTEVPATASLGYVLANNGDSGTCLLDGQTDLWDATIGPKLAAFVCGAAAAIDFEQTNGRITFAYKSQSGLSATVADDTVANNLGGNPQTSGRGNGYNFYGVYGAANANNTWFQRGFVTGDFAWLDSYINQIWLNNQFQVALLAMLGNSRSIPYNAAGNALIEATLAAPINAGLNFGAFAPGAISDSQVAAVNAQAGADIAGTLQTQGWYLQVKPASASARAARTSPPCTFFYLDRGSVQAITLASVSLQ